MDNQINQPTVTSPEEFEKATPNLISKALWLAINDILDRVVAEKVREVLANHESLNMISDVFVEKMDKMIEIAVTAHHANYDHDDFVSRDSMTDDIDDAVTRAIDDYDFSDKMGEAINDADIDDKIYDYMSNNDYTTEDSVRSIVADEIGQFRVVATLTKE